MRLGKQSLNWYKTPSGVVINGVAVSYDDLGSFYVSNTDDGYVYTPVATNLKPVSANARKRNFLAYMNIGIAEYLQFYIDIYFDGYKSLYDYLDDFQRNYPIFDTDEECLRVYKAMQGFNCCVGSNADENEDYEIREDKSAMGYCLKRDLGCYFKVDIESFFPRAELFFPRYSKNMGIDLFTLKQFITYLDGLYMFNPSRYCDLLFNELLPLMHYITLIKDSLFGVVLCSKSHADALKIYDKVKAMGYYTGNVFRLPSRDKLDEKPKSTIKLMPLISSVKEDILASGTIRYKLGGNIRYITDIRTFCMTLTALYSALVYNPYKYVLNDDVAYMTYKLNRCLGDDNVARLFSCRKLLGKKDRGWRSNATVPNIDTYEVYVVWKRSMQSTHTYSSMQINDFTWITYEEAWATVTSLVGNLYYTKLKTLDKIDSLEHKIVQLEDNLAHFKEKARSAKNGVSSAAALNEKDAEIAKLNARIAELERINVSKTNIIADKDEELKNLRLELEAVWGTDEAVLEADTDTVTLSDKIDYLNQFNVLFVTGAEGFESRLSELGMNSFRVLNSCGVAINNNTKYKADFVIYCTNFMSHSVINMAKAAYSKDAECLYYTGTNNEKMLCWLYDRVKTFMED